MNYPTLFAVDTFGEGSPVTVGLALGLLVVGIAWGEARVQISALREWKFEAAEQIKSLQAENAAIKSTASVQGTQIASILTLLGELRTDVKTLLNRRSENP